MAHGGKREGVGIDGPPTVIDDPMGTLSVLWDHPRQQNTKARQVLNRRVWEDYPLTLVDHVDEFFVKILDVFVGGYVQAPCEGAQDLAVGPRPRCKNH